MAIENAALEDILLTATDISTVCEIYASDAVPGDDGLDPEDAIECFAAVNGITFRGRNYKRLIKKFGRIKKTLRKEINSATVEFSNIDNQVSQFELNANSSIAGFEGKILVIRLISRSRSIALTDSQILFTGRCEKPKTGNRQGLTVSAKFILGGGPTNVMIPRRKFSKEDPEGRVSSDPEFEGFLHIPQYGTVSYSVRQKRGGIAGFFGFKKTVTKTLQWSSYSDLDANKDVPEVFGRAQILAVIVAYADVGSNLQVRIVFCEGEIEGITGERSTDSTLPIHALDWFKFNGLVGTANGPDDPGWAGANGLYSRSAGMRLKITNSAMDVTDPAPDIAAIILGRKMLTPDGSGDWVTTAWTNNGAAHTRFVITSPDYFKLNAGWIDDNYFTGSFDFNAESIFNTSLSDFTFVDAG